MAGTAGQRVAVIGATGFIGSHLTELLVRQGADVLAVSRGASRLEWLEQLAGGCRTASADIRDRVSIEGALRHFRPEVVYHLASNADAEDDFRSVEESIQVNITGTANALEAAHHAGAAVFVYADSCKVYGNGPTPYRQTQPDSPLCSYAVGKTAGWRLCLVTSGFTDMSVCALRSTFAYGPRQNLNLITYVQDCVQRRRPVRLMGGAQTRDPIYVEDLARAFVAAGTTPAAWGLALPVGGGAEISVTALSKQIVRLLGPDVEVVPDAMEPRRNEIWRSYCDNAEAWDVLGWRPEVSLTDGLARTLLSGQPVWSRSPSEAAAVAGELP
jgi:nucleoside-diphosphate-sugar epimerase